MPSKEVHVNVTNPSSSLDVSVVSDQNAPTVTVPDSPNTINVSAAEFVPSTTPSGATCDLVVTSASNTHMVTSEQPTQTSTSSVLYPTEVNVEQTSSHPGQTFTYPGTTLNNPPPESQSSTTFQYSGTNLMANLHPPVNPSVTTTPQYPGSILQLMLTLASLPCYIHLPTPPYHSLEQQPTLVPVR